MVNLIRRSVVSGLVVGMFGCSSFDYPDHGQVDWRKAIKIFRLRTISSRLLCQMNHWAQSMDCDSIGS